MQAFIVFPCISKSYLLIFIIIFGDECSNMLTQKGSLIRITARLPSD